MPPSRARRSRPKKERSSSWSGRPRARPSPAPGTLRMSARCRAPNRIASVLTGAKTFKNYIGGEWVDAASGETFESRNPANGDTIGVFPRSSAEDVDRAVEAAKSAYEEWRLVPAPRRGEILFRFGQLLADQKDDFADLMAHEMGKVLPEAAGDVQEAIDMSFYMGGEGRRLFGQTTPSELRDKFNMSVRMPIGVVGVITPWNFPIAIPSWKIAPALVCGNTVVFKPASDTPFLGERFVELLADAGVPPGVVNVVHGGGGVVGHATVEHPDVPVIRLAVSPETGVEVMRNASENLKHIHLELGGKNAIRSEERRVGKECRSRWSAKDEKKKKKQKKKEDKEEE